jgi:hypothetical protein
MTNLRLFFLLNVLDGLMTLLWISTGGSTEANPLMAYLLVHGAVLFMVVKVGIGFMVCLSLYAARHTTAAHRTLNVGVAVYALVIAMHLLVFRF